VIPCRTKLWRPSAAAEKYYAEQKPTFDKAMRDAHSRDATPYEFFLKSFGDMWLRNPLKHEFLILCWQEQWPDIIQIERRGVLNHWLVQMAKGLCFSKRLTMMGCGSSGKTGISAAYCYTTWKARPFNSSVFLSTTSSEAGESRTWGAVKDWHKSDQFKVGKRIESLHLITLDEEIRDEEGVKERDFRDVIKCINIKQGQEGKNVVASIVGRKNDIVIWQCDEFNFMDPGVLLARVNLNTNPRNQFIGINNAPEEGDPAYIDETPFGEKYPDGWRSVDKDRDKSWPTESGLCLYFNGARSPNYDALDGTIPFPKLMHEGMRADIEKDAKGQDTPGYWKQFYGFPPGIEISDKVLTVKLMQANLAFSEPVWMDTSKKTLAGLDLGFRAGGDPCVLHFGRIGKNLQQRTILELEYDGISLVPRQSSNDAFEVQIARQVIEACRAMGPNGEPRDCHDLALDVTGDGGILMQHIEREAREQGYALNVLPVSFSGTPEDRVIIPGEKRTAKQMFANMVAQLWGSFRVSVLNQVLCGMSVHSNCTKQLCARKMGTDEKKRMTIEKKSDMKLRIRRSPDHGDAACLLHHLALRHGLSGISIPVAPKPFDPQTFLRKQDKSRYQAPQRSIYGER